MNTTQVDSVLSLADLDSIDVEGDTLVDAHRWGEWAEDEIVTRVAERPHVVPAKRTVRPYRNF